MSRTIIELDEAIRRRRGETVAVAVAELRRANASQTWVTDTATVARVLAWLRAT